MSLSVADRAEIVALVRGQMDPFLHRIAAGVEFLVRSAGAGVEDGTSATILKRLTDMDAKLNEFLKLVDEVKGDVTAALDASDAKLKEAQAAKDAGDADNVQIAIDRLKDFQNGLRARARNGGMVSSDSLRTSSLGTDGRANPPSADAKAPQIDPTKVAEHESLAAQAVGSAASPDGSIPAGVSMGNNPGASPMAVGDPAGESLASANLDEANHATNL